MMTWKPRFNLTRYYRLGGLGRHALLKSRLLIVAVVAVGTLGVLLIVRPFSKTEEPIHGPHPDTLKHAESPVPPPPPAAPPQSTAAAMQPAPAPPPPKPQYGIAAGGAPVYWGQSDLDSYFNGLKALGVTWVRWDLDWNVVQSDGPGSYTWEAVDRVQATAERYGIQSLAILTYTPEWARNSGCKDDPHCAPADPAAFGRFASAAANRYKGRIKYWEIWNEPNFTFFWKPQPNAALYATVLRQAFAAIKAVDAGTTVLSGGLAASGDEADGSIAPITFMNSLYAQGANAAFDAVGFHPYTYPATPDYKAWWNRWQQIEPVRALMQSRGDSGKQIWLTEYGAPTGGPGNGFAANQLSDFTYGHDFMQEAAQQVLLQRGLDFYRPRVAWIGPFFWYSLRDEGTARDSTENFYGLLRADGSKKPAYSTYQNAIKAP